MRKYGFVLLIPIIAILFISCKKEASQLDLNDIQKVAESYVKLALQLGKFDKDYVDAYFGPEEIKKEAEKENLTLPKIREEANKSLKLLNKVDTNGFNELEQLRYKFLHKQLESLIARADELTGIHFSFDEEALKIYDSEVPIYPIAHYQKIIDSLDRILPGKGSISERYNAFRKQFIVPPSRVDTLFKAAINKCRLQTLKHIKLPANENFIIHYVKNKPWGAYNWFKGNAFSLIEINTDLPIFIDRVIDLAAHEGYPGHHVYHSTIEKNFYKDRNWVEFSVYPLFSPQSLISEGTANFGIDVAFPGNERIKFEKEVLFPLAGLNPQSAELYYKVLALVRELGYANIEAARRYLDGKMDKDEAVKWLVQYQLRSRESAEKSLSFITEYRAYIINYNLGEDMVREYINKKGGTDNNPDKRWNEFLKLISKPILPENLK